MNLAPLTSPVVLDYLRKWPATNVSAALIQEDRAATFGDIDHVFELKSVTKLLSAYAFLVAVEEGVFALDTVVAGIATVEQLLAHAGGVGFAEGDPVRPPLERRVYSSYGFELLARAVEEEAEMSFSEYASEAVFAPLGMNDTVIYGSAGHGSRSSVRDLVAFAGEVLRPRLVSEQTLADAFVVRYPELKGIVPGYGPYNPCPWGLGFEIKGDKRNHWTGDSMPADTAGHFGVAGTYLWVHRPTGRAMVALGDHDFGSWAKPYWTQLNDAAWGSMS
ncbi:serine hydrolase domain-containing protein [Corynebacterium vitaeruminis]|uniref:serine hydrolase domain-containing protein n=1 Tax=Corynebacterium vitaeruminis TaxID=38305 RepID=UPI000551C753|nr:serine hydrolase domain-containing protein [Corynebacterium vitaeruminis]